MRQLHNNTNKLLEVSSCEFRKTFANEAAIHIGFDAKLLAELPVVLPMSESFGVQVHLEMSAWATL